MREKFASKEVGYVTQVNNYLLTIKGLPSVRVNDIIADRKNRRAVIHSLYDDSVRALSLSKEPVDPGAEFFLDRESGRMNMGDHLKGSVVNALGKTVDSSGGNGVLGDKTSQELEFDVKAKNIDSRDFIKDQLVTGFALIDTIVPVGKGQRELVYGPIHSGKSEFLQSIVINQKKQKNICIYAAIGKPSIFTSRLIKVLKDNDALDNTVILSALSDEPAPMITVAPSTAFLIAEHFCSKGEDVVLILDDLGIHAKYIRESALLSGQFPGRESYPGDIFYQHAHLMERSGSFNEKQGNGTITLFPVLQTDVESFSNIIPTNLMASTDGHLFFSAEMHAEGFKPAVSILQSVTRVGHMTHNNLQRGLSTKLMNVLSEYPRQQEYSRFGTQMSEHTRDILKKGRVIYELLNQNHGELIPLGTQLVLLSLVFTSFFDGDKRDVDFVRFERKNLIKAANESDILKKAREQADSGEIGVEDFISLIEEGVKDLSALFDSKGKDTS
ncbi:MAG: hypothetical protein ACQESA_00795 [Patescibacteria group bacterium]